MEVNGCKKSKRIKTLRHKLKMLRNYQKVCNNLSINHNLAGLQSIRWRRKPRWLPTAPSKVFRVPERHVLPIDEKIEWQRLNNNYR